MMMPALGAAERPALPVALPSHDDDETYTLRQFLLMRALTRGQSWQDALAVVGPVAGGEVPEPRRTYRDWGLLERQTHQLAEAATDQFKAIAA